LRRIASLSNVTIHSISTHLPAADEDSSYTRAQLARFDELVARIRREVPEAYLVHVLLSAGIFEFSESAHDLVRAGLMLYGVSANPDFQELLRPVMTLKTRVALVRDVATGSSISYGRTFIAPRAMRVATLSAGYADGLPKAISNRDASVLIHGRRCAVLGRVTMDLTMVDVTDVPDVALGDEVVIVGRQGEAQILLTEIATRASTIPWAVLTGIGTRVPRVYG
jgi:alanine racemase